MSETNQYDQIYEGKTCRALFKQNKFAWRWCWWFTHQSTYRQRRYSYLIPTISCTFWCPTHHHQRVLASPFSISCLPQGASWLTRSWAWPAPPPWTTFPFALQSLSHCWPRRRRRRQFSRTQGRCRWRDLRTSPLPPPLLHQSELPCFGVLLNSNKVRRVIHKQTPSPRYAALATPRVHAASAATLLLLLLALFKGEGKAWGQEKSVCVRVCEWDWRVRPFSKALPCGEGPSKWRLLDFAVVTARWSGI